MSEKKYDFDLFVIGGGSGGIRAARWSASLGAKTALCEEDRLGGTCVIRGCIPKKLMVYSASFQSEFNIAKEYGWELESPIRLNWEKGRQARDKEIKRLEGIYRNILKNNNVSYIYGSAVLRDPHTVEIKGRLYTAKYILIAVGGQPDPLPIEGAELCLSSNEIFSLKKQPSSLLVIGAGYIGLEFASIFNSMGTQVYLMFRKSHILSGFDMDLRVHLQEELKKKGIQLIAETNPVKIEKTGEAFCVTDDNGTRRRSELILMATGRKANTAKLNLSTLGIQTKGSKILVNKNFQTNIPNVFAVGDCADQPYQLTPVALSQGMFVSELLFADRPPVPFNNDNIPSAVFTQPETAVVGLSEQEALKRGFQVKIYESCFRPLKLTVTKFQEKSYIKLIVCKDTDRLLGCHIVDHNAAEILQGFAVAIQNKLKKSDLDRTIGIHPTSAEELVSLRIARK